MAESFKNRVDALTGFGSTDDSPLNDWLTDGAREIVNVLPDDLLQYCVDYTAMTSSTAMNIGTDTDIGKIMFVTRNNGTRYLPCRLIPATYFGFVDDPSSLTYHGTTADPVYSIISDGTNAGVNVFPNPTSSFNARVHHVAFPDVGGGDTDIDNFPDNAEYLVVLYAAQKALLRLMNNKNGSLSALSITSVSPDTPTITTVSFGDVTGSTFNTTTVSFSQAVPSYSPPNITANSGTQPLTEMEAISSNQLGNDTDFIDFEMWFAALGEMIEDDEDIELASAQIEKINSYIAAYNISMQNELNNFNESVAPYQAQLQISLQNANMAIQERIQEAQLSQQANLQTSVNNMQAIIQDNNNKVQKFQTEISEYQAEVTTQVQEYTQNLQKDAADYGWLQGQYTQLKSDYVVGLTILKTGDLPKTGS